MVDPDSGNLYYEEDEWDTEEEEWEEEDNNPPPPITQTPTPPGIPAHLVNP